MAVVGVAVLSSVLYNEDGREVRCGCLQAARSNGSFDLQNKIGFSDPTGD